MVDRLKEVAAGKAGPKPAQVALAWLLHRPGVNAPIIGASKMSHLEDAVAATEIKLTADEMRLLEEPYRPHPILGHS